MIRSLLARLVCSSLLILVPTRLLADELGDIVVPGQIRGSAVRLQEARQRLQDGKLAEAIALLQRLVESGGNDLVEVEPGHSLQTRWVAQTMLAKLAPADRAEYRKRLLAARRWLEEADQDEAWLHRILDEAFCSPEAVLALDRLGDRAFLRGRFDEAELFWRRIRPLDTTDLSSSALVHPDVPTELGIRALAKQLLARLARKADDFAASLEAFRRQHGKASGTLAGQTGVYADLLARLATDRERDGIDPTKLASSGDWPTYAGDPSRNRIQPAPAELPTVLARLCRSGPTYSFDLQRRQLQKPSVLSRNGSSLEQARQLAHHPVLIGRLALLCDGRFVTAYDLESGQVNTWFDAADHVGGIGEVPANPVDDLRYTLTVAEECVFARLGTSSIRDVRPTPRVKGRPRPGLQDEESLLVSLSLRPGPAGQRFRWMVRAIDPERRDYAVFEGSPVVRDGRVFIAATRFSGDRVVTAIQCYPAHPEDIVAPILWRTDVCETRELLPAGAGNDTEGRQRRYRHHLLTLAGHRVVYCSHSGVLVAVDARSGQRLWALRYARRDTTEPEDEPTLRDLTPCVFADGRLYAAPADSDRVYCLDPDTGAILWERRALDVVHLVGVAKGRLLFTTWRNGRDGRLVEGGLRAIRAADGSDDGGWILPDDGGGLNPMGRPVLVGDFVLWPTARKPFGVFAIRQDTGQQTDNPTLLHRVPSGHLLFGNGCLVVTTPTQMIAYVPSPDEAALASKAAASETRHRLAPERVPLPERSEQRGRPEPWLRQLTTGLRGAEELVALVGLARAWEQQGCVRSANALWDYLEDTPSAASIPTDRPLSLPRSRSLEVALRPAETFLPLQSQAEGPLAGLWFTCHDGAIQARCKKTGQGRWRSPMPFRPTWADCLGTLLIVGSPHGLAALTHTGERLWTWSAPRGPLSDFQRLTTQVVAREGSGSLVSLGLFTGQLTWRRSAPAAAFALPPPRGCVHSVQVVADRLLVQVSSRLWLLEADSGEVVGEWPAPLSPLPRLPVLIDANRVCVVPQADQIACLDARQSRLLWSYRPPGRTTRSGEAPLIVPAGQAVIVVEPLNYGCRLQRLEATTGRPTWDNPPLLQLERLELSAWLCDGQTLWYADAGRLHALDAVTGLPRWQQPLADSPVWRLARSGSTLLVWPERAAAVRYCFSWLGRQHECVVGPLPEPQGWSVQLFDAASGRLRQRLAIEPERLTAQRQSRPAPSVRLWPVAGWWREPQAAPGPVVNLDSDELVLAVGNRWSLWR